MTTTKATQRVIDQLRSGELSDADMVALLHHPAALVRVNAIEAIAKQVKSNDDMLGNLIESASDPMNQVRLMGTINVSDVALCWLLKSGDERALAFVHEYVTTLSKSNRADLLTYLRSEGVGMFPE